MIVHAYVNPVVAVILGIALHEGVTLRQAAGMALVAGSVALTLYRSAGPVPEPDGAAEPRPGAEPGPVPGRESPEVSRPGE